MGTTLQTPLAKEIDVANTKAKYDAQIKKLLSNKNILAWILKYTVKEFSNYSIEQIKPCIEGTPEVSCTPVEPGMTNAEVITGDNTEDVILNEGRIFYDIKFYVILQNSEHTKIIINVEAQKNNTDYNIVARAIFYCARLLSAQLDKEFTNKTDDKKKYDGMKKVYSIWICMDSPLDRRCSIKKYSFDEHILYGHPTDKSRYDFLNVVMVYLGGDDLESESELINMLTTLLSSSIDRDKKKQKLQEEYHIPMTIELEREVDNMCNLSDYVVEKGIEKGIEKGEKIGIEKGEKIGIEKGEKIGIEKILTLYSWLKENNRSEEAEAVMEKGNEELRTILFAEFNKTTKE